MKQALESVTSSTIPGTLRAGVGHSGSLELRSSKISELAT